MKAYQNLNITGSINLSGSFFAGDLNATASNAILAATASSITSLNQPVTISGSFTVFTGSGVELQVTDTGVRIGNQTSDNHLITGSLLVSGSTTITGSVNISGSLLVNGLPAGSGGGATVTVSGSAPSGSVSSGSLWYNPTGSGLYVQTTSPTGSTYVLLNPPPVTISGSAPSGSFFSGSLWWNNVDGNLYIQVTGPTGSTYVPATNTVAGGNYGATYVLGFTGSTWNVNHNLATRTPLVTVYSGSEVMVPASITSLDANNTRITFSGSVQGTAILSTGIGNTTTNNAVSASFATTASFATNALLATTASSVTALSQSVLISGSLNVFNNELQVSSTGVNIGNIITDRHNVTGSLNVSGSITAPVVIIPTVAIQGNPNQAINNSSTTYSTSTRISMTAMTTILNQGGFTVGSTGITPTVSGIYEIRIDAFGLDAGGSSTLLTSFIGVNNAGVAQRLANFPISLYMSIANSAVAQVNAGQLIDFRFGSTGGELITIQGASVFVRRIA